MKTPVRQCIFASGLRKVQDDLESRMEKINATENHWVAKIAIINHLQNSKRDHHSNKDDSEQGYMHDKHRFEWKDK